jgi:branched-chain amino acid aminotransferase
MNPSQLYAVIPDGPRALTLPAGARNIHELFDDLPLGVYTVLRTFEHEKFLRLDDHLDRLQQSMTLLGWEYRLDRQRLRWALHQVCRAYPAVDAQVRLDILAQSVSWSGHGSRELIGLFPFSPIPEAAYRSGVRVAIAERLSRELPRAKQAQFARERRSYLQDSPDFFECLMLDQEGLILEGTTSNFYAVKDGVLWTAGSGVLEGVARKIVLDVAEDLAIPVRLEAVHVDEIGRLDECALSSSSRAIIPIVNVAGQTVADGRPGPVARRLLVAYNEYVAGAIKPAVNTEG